MWFEHGLEWWRQLEFHQVLWLVMLESAKDQVLGVDTPGQQVASYVRYGTTC
jgi:hypothetical protein